MKKRFSSLVAASAAATLNACGKKATNTDTKTTTTTEKTKPVITKGSVAKGSFKIGYAGWNTDFTKSLKDAITTYTQDITIKSQTGVEYFKLPSGLSLLSSDKFNSYVRETAEYKDQVAKLRKYLLGVVKFGTADQKYGYFPGSNYFELRNNPIRFMDSVLFASNVGIIILMPPKSIMYLSTQVMLSAFNAIFSAEKIAKLYDALKSIPGDKMTFRQALTEAGIKYSDADPGGFTSSHNILSEGKEGVLYINTVATTNIAVSGVSKTFAELKILFEAKIKTALADKTKLAAKNLDALFVQVTDGVENSADVYKAVVEKKEFGATKLFFIGDKAKSQSGASSKVFAGGHVSTASFNKYAAAYVAGFQAAVGTIKYSSSEDIYQETATSFLIGSTSDSESKKKAFAFRRGVEAAAAHGAYSKYLKVKFVSKTEDSSKSSKKLYREVSEWKSRENSKSKLYEFSSSDTFSDADRRVIYLAGTTVRDWTGLSTTTTAIAGSTLTELTTDDKVTFEHDDDTGLIGALYNYKTISNGAQTAKDATSKTYARGVWVVLDKAKTPTFSSKASDNNMWIQHGAVVAWTTLTPFERHEVKFYGAIGDEVSGTTQYVKVALKGLYMGGPNYMLGKHTIFGAPLNNSLVERGSTLASGETISVWTKGSVWGNATGNTSGGQDSADKAKDRYETSLTHTWEKEVTEAELVKASPWLK